MYKEALKWKKHLLLVEYGLRDYDNLVSEIHRFSKNDIERLIYELSLKLVNNKLNGINAFYVIKFVKKEQYYKLPNFRIYNGDDLITFQSILCAKKYPYDEIWYCETIFDEDNIKASVAGRISFEREVGGNSQIVEQVWNKSPRLIEDFNPSVDYIYIRASRCSWGHRYNVDKVHIPQTMNIKSTEIENQFANSVIEIEREREKIEVFEEFLSKFQYRCFSLEYKIINGKFHIIDWDTPNDMLVLGRK